VCVCVCVSGMQCRHGCVACAVRVSSTKRIAHWGDTQGGGKVCVCVCVHVCVCVCACVSGMQCRHGCCARSARLLDKAHRTLGVPSGVRMRES
jgi:hypothetical protein